MTKKSRRASQPRIKKTRIKPTKQTGSFFGRETLEGLLVKADKDPKKGGIQFYITAYTEEVAKKYHPKDAEKLTGALTLVMRPANFENELVTATVDDNYENRGRICPPFCNPQPEN